MMRDNTMDGQFRIYIVVYCHGCLFYVTGNTLKLYIMSVLCSPNVIGELITPR